ncbi:MAG: response regulator [Gammaproteobacteria bacterium]|nr:response regulator [Gammaproteobacteria bacterium]
MKIANRHDFQEPIHSGGIPPRGPRPSAARLLIVEDDPDISSLLAYTLQAARYRTTVAADCELAWQILNDNSPDLVLLDWMLPDRSGLELLQQMRQNIGLRDIPVIMLTARSTALDRACGLENGVDDYIVKPFSPRELCVRIHKQLCKPGSKAPGNPDVTGISLHPQGGRVCVNGTFVELGPTLFRLLQQLVNNSGRLLTRKQLLDTVWGRDVYVEERTLELHIQRLRKILAPFQMAELIETVRACGYCFSESTLHSREEVSE